MVRTSKANPRKFSSTSLVEFLTNAIDALPEISEVSEAFQQYLDELEMLSCKTQEIAPMNTPEKSRIRTLTSEFEIQSRPGMRATKVSQKLRQEKDRENMSSQDQEYTKLLESLNDYLKEIFQYPPQPRISD